MPQSRMIKGTAVSMGLAHGPLHVVRGDASEVPTWVVPAEDVPAEIGRLAAALQMAAEELERQQRVVAKSGNEKDAEIFAVHRMILQDPSALGEVEKAIAEERINAEAAVSRLIARFGRTMSGLDGASVRGFASDVSDPWRRVLDTLLERDRRELGSSDEKVVLAAPELTPRVCAWLPRERVLAIVCESGGRFSHGAVLARSMGLPCVIGLPGLLARLEQGMHISVDADRGQVQLKPSDEDLSEFQRRLEARQRRQAAVESFGPLPARAACGHRIETQVNIESLLDLPNFDPTHTDGVGLLRTEFLYMERQSFPSEEEQYRLYRRVVEYMRGRQVTIRTLDIGADKQLPYFQTPKERNPALGWRGLRISLQWPDLLQVQLRAALRASAHGPLRILLPMVGSLEQIEQTHRIFDSVRRGLLEQGYDCAEHLPVGAMIEVPSALLSLHQLIAHVDFVSVGTNDLVQYLLAVDRDNAFVAGLYDPFQPAVLSALQRIADVAGRAGKPCSVCGDIAADPAFAVLLMGLGYDAVSTAPHFVPEIKYALSRVSLEQARSLVREVLAAERGQDIKRLLKDWQAEVRESPAH
jgi:phosphoenolpyruvate-protein phosphotransferase (PTS system enzyme I)